MKILIDFRRAVENLYLSEEVASPIYIRMNGINAITDSS